ncbi:hypothetical protein HanOQP8_Chr01g0015941 [Helianthus annuus]|nr:hypothetical protein HanOQP8_Chr01g0015941 [Helianthus annuus]
MLLIRKELRSGKGDIAIYKKLEYEYEETILNTPKFDWHTADVWLSLVSLKASFNVILNIIEFRQLLWIQFEAPGGIRAYSWHMQRTNVHLLAFNLTRGIPLTPRAKETMLDILSQPAPWWLFLVLF